MASDGKAKRKKIRPPYSAPAVSLPFLSRPVASGTIIRNFARATFSSQKKITFRSGNVKNLHSNGRKVFQATLYQNEKLKQNLTRERKKKVDDETKERDTEMGGREVGGGGEEDERKENIEYCAVCLILPSANLICQRT